MSVVAPKSIIGGVPVEYARVSTTAKVTLREGMRVEYTGRLDKYHGKVLTVVAIRRGPYISHTLVYLHAAHSSQPYDVLATSHEVLAVVA